MVRSCEVVENDQVCARGPNDEELPNSEHNQNNEAVVPEHVERMCEKAVADYAKMEE